MTAVKKAKISYIAYSSVLIICGLMLIVFPVYIKDFIEYFIGAVILVCGIVKLIDYFVNDSYGLAFQFDFAMGIFTILIGLIVLIHPGEVIKFINIVIGIFVILDGTFKLQTAKEAKQFGLKAWNRILISAIIASAAGLFLIFQPFESVRLLNILLGVAILADGAENLIVALYTVRLIRRNGKVNENI